MQALAVLSWSSATIAGHAGYYATPALAYAGTHAVVFFCIPCDLAWPFTCGDRPTSCTAYHLSPASHPYSDDLNSLASCEHKL